MPPIFMGRIIVGCTRIVLELDRVVIKIPNFIYQWNHFLLGLVANMNETRLWKYNSGKYEKGNSHLLCPVKWSSCGGWLLIMTKADVDRHMEEVGGGKAFCYASHINAGFDGDNKASNFGYLDNRLVKVDYGQ